MRFSDRITFVTEGNPQYDPDLGDYVGGNPIEDTKPCKLSTMGTDRTNEVFGKISIKIIIARLQRPYLNEFDHILIKDGIYKGKYQVKRQSNYRKGVFYLEGV